MKTSELIFYTVTAIALVAVVPSGANADEPPSAPNIQQYLNSQGVGQQNPMNTDMNNLVFAHDQQSMAAATNTNQTIEINLEKTDPKELAYGAGTMHWYKFVTTFTNTGR